MHRAFNAGLLIPCLLLAAGCTTSHPHYAHPDLTERVRGTTETTLITDVVLMKDTGGSLDLVDVPRSLSFGKALVDSASAHLRRKGYVVSFRPPSTVGRTLSSDTPYRALWDEEKRGTKADSLPIAHPPFIWDGHTAAYVNMNALRTARFKRGRMVTDVPLVGPPTNETTILLAVVGRHVPPVKQIGRALLSSLASQGPFPRTHLQVALFIVEASTGQILWADTEADVNDLSIDLEDAIGTLNDVMAKLPKAPRTPE